MTEYYKTKKPKVTILHTSPIWVAEYAGRTAYNSFNKSENIQIQERDIKTLKTDDIDSSELLNQLSWVYHHESVLEHINVTFLIEGASRAVLQELSRHRIASYTVKSTRYTMTDVLYAYISASNFREFTELLPSDFIVLEHPEAIKTELQYIRIRLDEHKALIGGNEFEQKIIPKALLEGWEEIKNTDYKERFNYLKQKTKKNIGDEFKYLVTDNFSTDLVMTMNIRSLKNFMKLRNSGSAFFQIRTLAKEMLKELPNKYKGLVWKNVDISSEI